MDGRRVFKTCRQIKQQNLYGIMKTLFFLTFALLVIESFGQKVRRKPIQNIPQLSMYNINGDTTDLKTIAGNKITFLDFWFIPCGPCFAEMNMLHRLYAKYKGNPNIAFLTITLTDSAFVRPLTENRNTAVNETYDYFKSLTQLDSFKLPVYFLKDVSTKMISFTKAKIGFSGHGEPQSPDADYTQYPGNVFGFSGYPTIFIFDKNGSRIYYKTAFGKDGEKQQQKSIEEIINSKL